MTFAPKLGAIEIMRVGISFGRHRADLSVIVSNRRSKLAGPRGDALPNHIIRGFGHVATTTTTCSTLLQNATKVDEHGSGGEDAC